jgi:hypothetical protein
LEVVNRCQGKIVQVAAAEKKGREKAVPGSRLQRRSRAQ